MDLLREYIVELLCDQVLNEQLAGVEGATSKSALANLIASAAKNVLPSGDFSSVEPKKNHYRIHTQESFKDSDSAKEDLAKKMMAQVTGVPLSSMSATTNTDPMMSKTYDYQLINWTDTSGDTHEIKLIFASTATSGGQRVGGYEYEVAVRDAINSCVSGACYQNTDTKGVDVIINLPDGGTAEIETKLLNAKFGQPTLAYNYRDGERGFEPSKRTKDAENASLVASLLNSTSARSVLSPWMAGIKRVWEKTRKAMGDSRPQFDEFNAISLETYGDSDSNTGMWAHGLADVGMSKGPIESSPGKIVDYYIRKGAHYIQIEKKGLYQFSEVNPLGFGSNGLPALPMFGTALAETDPKVKVEILTSGGAKKLRATTYINMRALPESTFSLDDPEQVKLLTNKLKKMNDSSAESLVREYIREALLTEAFAKTDE